MQSNQLPFVGPEGTQHAMQLTLVVSDAEVIVELGKHPVGTERNEFAVRALRLGVHALRDASGMLDAESMRREGEHILGSLREVLVERTTQMSDVIGKTLTQYFDPTTGSLPQRIEQLVKRDGELETMLSKHLDGDRSTIAQTLAKHIGESSPIFRLLAPEQADGLVAALAATLQKALDEQRDAVLTQFSLDKSDSALSRLVSEVANSNGKLRGELAKDLAKVAGEFSLDNKDGALARLVGRVELSQKTIAEQFSLDHKGSAMQRLSSALEKTNSTVTKSLTLDDKTSPLSRLRAELMGVLETLGKSNGQFQTEVRTTLEALKVRREEAARTTTHGHTFEDAVGDLVRDEAQRNGDVHEWVGTQQGRAGRKVGDHVTTLGPESAAPGARIVVEAKADKTYTEKKALDELAIARKNRDAQVGVFVLERASAGADIDAIRRVGSDILVVWDPDDAASDVYLKVALSLARFLVVRERAADAKSTASLREMDTTIRDIEAHVETLESIVKAARGVKTKGESILSSADQIREALLRQVASLRKHVQGLNRDAAGSRASE